MSLTSLVKYDTPLLVSEAKKKNKTPLLRSNSKSSGKKNLPSVGKKQTLPPVENKSPVTQTEDILNNILPPRYNNFLQTNF